MESIPLPFGETLLSWRVFREMTQAQLAEKAGVPRSNLSDMERGRREVTLGTLRALAAALGVKPGILADGVGSGQRMESLSRDALERVAGAAAGLPARLDPAEKVLSTHVRDVVRPASAGGRIPARRTDRAWLSLRAALPPEALGSLIRRTREKMADE